ncbi:MAG: tail fiber domain-containing protein, partial [Pseudomonadota bacterium]
VLLDENRLVNIDRHTAGIVAGAGADDPVWNAPTGITEASATTLQVNYSTTNWNTGAGGSLNVRANSGGQGGTANAHGIFVEDTADGSSWDTSNPFGLIGFKSADTTGAGAGVRAQFGAIPTGSTHGGTLMRASVASSSGLVNVADFHPALGLRIPVNYGVTTASAANMFIDSDGDIQRSTSSERYKTDVQTVDTATSEAIIGALRPIRYRSKGQKDNPDWSWYGLLAEEVAEIDPRLVLWDKEGRPDGVFYERAFVHLINVVKSLAARLDALEGGKASAPPPVLQQLQKEGETIEEFRQRMREWRASLHSKMMGAKEGVGEFSDDERQWLEYLERSDWVGRGA